MPDDPLPLPLGQHEIEQEIGGAFDHSLATIPAPHGQMFAFDEAPPTLQVASENVTPIDPLVRLEQKVDALLHMVAALRVKIDSIDSVLARIIHR